MSSFELSLLDDSSSEEEYERAEGEDIALIMMVHMERNKLHQNLNHPLEML